MELQSGKARAPSILRDVKDRYVPEGGERVPKKYPANIGIFTCISYMFGETKKCERMDAECTLWLKNSAQKYLLTICIAENPSNLM